MGEAKPWRSCFRGIASSLIGLYTKMWLYVVARYQSTDRLVLRSEPSVRIRQFNLSHPVRTSLNYCCFFDGNEQGPPLASSLVSRR